MYQSNIKTSGHTWEKQNLVTITSKGKMYDKMICKNCGMKGIRYGFTSVEVSEKYKFENVNRCPKAEHVSVPKMVRVIKCTAFGKQFSNILPDTIHDVVNPPQGYKNDHTGIWVMGVGEPVKLVTGEFVHAD